MTTDRDRSYGRVRRLVHGVRTRVVVGSLLLLIVAFVASTLVTRQMLLVGAAEETENQMAQEIEELRALAGGISPETGLPFGEDVEAVFATFLSRSVPAEDEAFYTFVGGEPFRRSFDAPAALFDDRATVERWTSGGSPTWVDVHTAAGDATTLAVPLLGDSGQILGTFVVAIFPASDRAEVDRVVRTLLIVAGTVLVLLSIAAWTMAGRVLRPVAELTTTARTISASDLTTRIPVEGDDELSELGRTFNRMLDRLEESFRGQRAFLDDVAHELRTPITIVRGHLEVLGDDPAERAETVELVTDELDRMSRYVSDLLLVARSSQPDFLQLDLVDAGELVDDVRARSAPLAARDWRRGGSIGPAEVFLLADADRLVQALLALVTNAVQHTTEGDWIELGADAPAGEVRLWVADSGPGIDPADRERIFTRFSRGTTSSTTRPEGTGLGLAIVAAIARAHGGRVELDSSTGAGATFRIVVPRSRPPEELS